MLSKEGRILTVGVVLLLSYLGWIIATYAFSANDANDLLVLTVTNFLFGRAAGISYGFSVGFGDGLIILVNIAIELITVLLVYPLFVFSWKRSLEIRGFKDFFATVKALRVKHSVFFGKYGRYGLFLFVWFPFWMTGPVVGSIIGFLIGIKHYQTMLIVLSGTSLAIVVWTYFIKELLSLLHHISAYAPYILLALFISIAIAFKFLKAKEAS
jgi:uncharacterized membrane protein